MTVDTIFTRYNISVEQQEDAFVCAARAYALHDQWVGREVAWDVVVKALLFAFPGDTEHGAHVRKKVGLDKYATTLIARGAPHHLEKTLEDCDVQQLVYLYCLYAGDVSVQHTFGAAWAQLTSEIEHNTMRVPAVSGACPPALTHRLRDLEVYHYKNPSV